LLKHSRKQRIAKGSGTNAADINKLLKMHRQMADMMKAMGGKGKGGMMKQMMGGLGAKMGLGGMGSMPDLSKMDPKQLEALQKQAEAAGFGKGGGLPGGLGGLPGGLGGLGGGMPRLPGLGGGLPGLPKKKG
jgi:signal recognition particle subunit SRP54